MGARCREPYPVAMIPYINMLPFRLMGPPLRCCWRDYVPRESVGALAAGRVIAAAVPVGALEKLEGCVQPLGRFGIAARETSMSVLFFSGPPFDDIHETDRMRITPDSATSVRLLYLLLRYQQSAQGPRRAAGGNNHVGELIIGDQAMQRMVERRPSGAYPLDGYQGSALRYRHVTDLATRWYQRHRLPFVFARWVIRRDAPPAARAILLDWLNGFREREDELVRRAIPIAAQSIGLPEAHIADYYRCLRRVLDDAEIEGQALFLREIRRNRIDTITRPQTVSAKGSSTDLRSHPRINLPPVEDFRARGHARPAHGQTRVHQKEAL